MYMLISEIHGLVVLHLLVYILMPRETYRITQYSSKQYHISSNSKRRRRRFNKKKEKKVPGPPPSTYLSQCFLRKRYITTIPDKCVIKYKE